MQLNETEAKRLAERVLALSKADETQVTISGDGSANTRFAANSVTTSGYTEDMSVSIDTRFGKRRGIATTNELSDDALMRAVRNSEQIAHLSPEDPELQPVLDPQKYSNIDLFSEKTANADPVWRAQ